MPRVPINCFFLVALSPIVAFSLARPPPPKSDFAETKCPLGEPLFNAALVNSTKKFGEGLVVEEAMGVTIDSTDWSELNLTREEARDCLKEYFKYEQESVNIEDNPMMEELPASDEADDEEKVSTYLKPYNFREKGYFVKNSKDKPSLWTKVTHYYDGFVDKVADFIGISD